MSGGLRVGPGTHYTAPLERWQSPAYCTCLENRRTARYRGFKSLSLRCGEFQGTAVHGPERRPHNLDTPGATRWKRGRAAECARLESVYTGPLVSWVRIPPFPYGQRQRSRHELSGLRDSQHFQARFE
jgi:hypothetical protein